MERSKRKYLTVGELQPGDLIRHCGGYTAMIVSVARLGTAHTYQDSQGRQVASVMMLESWPEVLNTYKMFLSEPIGYVYRRE